MYHRSIKENFENQNLAPYAMKAESSKGRSIVEEEHPYRTVFERDRDRIVHSSAFRRLEYKTQVFVNHVGDHYRTRLTHSLEVSGLARTVARCLLLNEDLVETVALAHDLGHPPFGHAGERILHRMMSGSGGFDHNKQTLRVVTFLEKRNPDYKGLNLSYETKECLSKHHPEQMKLAEYHPEDAPLLESCVVDVCDEIAYNNHDLDDGLRAQLLREEDLRGIALWEKAAASVNEKYSDLDFKTFRAQVVQTLIGMMVGNLIENSQKNILKNDFSSVEDVRLYKGPVIAFDSEMAEMKRELEQYLFRDFYRQPTVNRMMFKAELYIEKLFEYYVDHKDSMPKEFQKIANEAGIEKAVCDYLAGMTDRYAQQAYEELYSPFRNI